ncbi:hypothetical protein CW749_02260 [Vibrio sp. vnigr-6D03]|uniref:FAD/NAD(P)-binding protein n=1 Tax=Vibrio sp. vnigr-6D03 TaxID=2058088 RepID=UPI000C32A938|nr:FAD/NAD(P)-binding protein [Vibrio sp. vnigr-6D03]PKF81485.1 hypothetical protein CW749_02260 [Vibrio sp. vnigr-6D03]
MEMYDIAIVGFGATGVGLLNEMQNELFTKRHLTPSVAIFNSSSSFVKGKAFGDAAPAHIVNTPPELMSASALEPNSFSRWLTEQTNAAPQWPTRVTFAKYLEYIYDDIKAANLIHSKEFMSDVVGLIKEGGRFILTLEDGKTICAHEVVLCLGSINAQNFTEFYGNHGFIKHHSEFERVPSNHILVAGSGLTAVDAFRHIAKKQQATVKMFSRSGLAPTCLSESNQYVPKHLSWNALVRENHLSPLKAFMKLLLAEHRALKGNSEFRYATRLLHSGKQAEYFDYLKTRALNGDLPWQDVLVSTRYWFHKLWKAMPLSEKSEFMRRFGALWSAWRHPIPIDSFSQLGGAVKDQKLQFYKALSTPLHKNGVFEVSTTNGTLVSDSLWDGTGGNTVLKNTESRLLQQMFKQGYAEAHPCGGLVINPKTFEIIADGKAIDGLYNIGPLNRGVLFSTNAYWFNAQCSEKWAHQWLKRITIKEELSKETHYS